MEKRYKFCSNKAMVAYLIKNGCKCHDVKLGRNDTLVFGFDKTETDLLAKVWFDREHQRNNQPCLTRESV